MNWNSPHFTYESGGLTQYRNRFLQEVGMIVGVARSFAEEDKTRITIDARNRTSTGPWKIDGDSGLMIEIYTDGACSGNPGPGGWGALLRISQIETELCGGEPATTNNRMELLAVIKALQSLTGPVEALVYTDSQYVQKGISEWIHNWKRRGWKTASKESVKNEDLWRRLDALAAGHTIEWRWVKGHAGHPDNERVDALARAGLEQMRQAAKAVSVENKEGENLF